ncbi:lantibiotic dehydratase [Streptomyces sp. NPDC057705]|uniref:lantibiotic dehydratase n=1 Tax=Streptomyces sp. NPDC057705 TaxID=3346222 RepID=UPI0036774600
MPQPHPTPGADGYRVGSAPYALARATVLAHPAQHPAPAAFRDLLARLHRLHTELALTAAPLGDDLYAARDGHPADFHRDVVLPLRRALHNGREPRPAVLARLGDLPARLPRLAAWLALRADRDTLLTALDAATGPALDAERAGLAALCREPALAKATALTSADLLRAVNRAATGAADRRARKEEPTVLRYALRASTKTSPLSWFTAVGWGPLAGAPADGPARPVTSWGAATVLDSPLRSVVRANRTLTTALTLALLDAPHRRTTLPHRITSTARTAGGRCAHPWEFGADVTAAWESAGRIALLDPADRDAFPSATEPLARLRAEVADALRDPNGPAGRDIPDHSDAPHASDAFGASDAFDEAVLPADLLKTLGDRLPAPTVERPLSYAYFLQRDPAAGLLAVNHVYGGWGRFASRFLDSLDPRATAEVSRQIRRGLGPGARPAQIRPVGGFNANLHPLLVPDEIGPDRHRTPIAEADLELVHDEATDQVRICLRTTGEPLDVLYPGFLAPVLLPARIAPHLGDHPGGVVDFRPLAPRRALAAPGGRVTVSSRLRHRHVVLQRRRWLLPSGVVARLRADLAAETGPGRVPAAAAANWRALLGLPEQVFLHPVAGAPTGRATEDFLSRLARPKPHLADLGNALHLRCLAKWLSRHTDGVVLEEALPAPGGLATPVRAVELVLEVYRDGRRR